MNSPSVLKTTEGDIPLSECRIAVGGREWAVAYSAAVVTQQDENRFLKERTEWMPYGVALWPAALAIAHEIATRAGEFRGRTVLELGAGTGLPGIVASSLAAKVVQTDFKELPLHICQLNGQRNGATGIEYRLADWTEWNDPKRYDWIIGSDILYADSLHESLQRIFVENLAPGGRLLLADPYRAYSLLFMEDLERAGWKITHSRWSIGEGEAARPVAVYELIPPSVKR
jgi:predicted nicotinamide N-methyase